MSIQRSRPIEILRAIKEATAKHDPSYRLKKRGLLNAHDMKRLIPSREKLIYGQEIKFRFNNGQLDQNDPIIVDGAYDPVKISGMAETDIKKLYPKSIINYAMNDIINTTDVVKHLKG